MLYIKFICGIKINCRKQRIIVKKTIFVLAFSLLLVGCHHGDLGESPDVTEPTISVPGTITIAAVDASGTPVTDASIADFLSTVSALDGNDGPVNVFSDAPSVFPIGDTTVTFTATDLSSNKSSVVVVVTVVDLTPPLLILADDITFQSSMVGGVVATRSEIVDFLNSVSAEDNVDGSVEVSNDAPSDFFPFGETLVEFVATDASGNTATATGIITVNLEVRLTDFNPTTQITDVDRLPATSNNGVLDTDLTPKPLNLQNLKNALVEGDFHTPEINSVFGGIPTGSGAEMATISVFDGFDSNRDTGERFLEIDLVFNWTADGETLLIDFPAQILNGRYINAIDTVINLTLENTQDNSFTITKEGVNYAENFDEKFLVTLGKLSDIPLDELLDTGIYTFQLKSTLPFALVDGSSVTVVDAIVEIKPED